MRVTPDCAAVAGPIQSSAAALLPRKLSLPPLLAFLIGSYARALRFWPLQNEQRQVATLEFVPVDTLSITFVLWDRFPRAAARLTAAEMTAKIGGGPAWSSSVFFVHSISVTKAGWMADARYRMPIAGKSDAAAVYVVAVDKDRWPAAAVRADADRLGVPSVRRVTHGGTEAHMRGDLCAPLMRSAFIEAPDGAPIPDVPAAPPTSGFEDAAFSISRLCSTRCALSSMASALPPQWCSSCP